MARRTATLKMSNLDSCMHQCYRDPARHAFAKSDTHSVFNKVVTAAAGWRDMHVSLVAFLRSHGFGIALPQSA